LHDQTAQVKRNRLGLFLPIASLPRLVGDCRLPFHNFQGVPQRQRVKNGFQVMVTIFTFANNMKPEIYFAIGKNNHRKNFVILGLRDFVIW